MLGAKTAIDAVCARHGLQRSDLQDHADILGFDVGIIDDDAAQVEQVQTTRSLLNAWYAMQSHPPNVSCRVLRRLAVLYGCSAEMTRGLLACR